ncbi:hypothetical protein SB49_07530 [Sediminicola sp. YIK13]|uniref:hypothetical protein n=1 Tax=Sediminicola sp. YIK13 TaxID=1453352 RepID=UPI00071FAF75|nr:hypothetical protein [Sediminicola sp. YIK13]ALM07674.1 hypothetical protein SB49_07530 [Sediminicola sp. YIK13]
MKKVIFCAAALMAGSMVFAQTNTSNVTQMGTGNYGTVDQVGTMNMSNVDVNGNTNGVDIDQSGANNSSDHDVYPDATYGGGDNNWVKVDQVGTDNISVTLQTGNNFSADVKQDGSGHMSTVNQLHFDGLYDGAGGVWVEQYGTNQESLVEQAGVAGGRAYVKQYNANNISAIYQQSEDELARVTQYGDMNDSYVSQNASLDVNGGLATFSNVADVWQDGVENTSSVTQDGFGGENVANIQQYGNTHNSVLTQTGIGNNMTVIQND